MSNSTNGDAPSDLLGLERQVINGDFTNSFSEILLMHLQLPSGSSEVPDDVDLMKLGLDSISAVALLLDLEDAFGITFPQSMINVELYHSSSSLKQAVLAQMENKPLKQ